MKNMTQPLIEVKGLKKYFDVKDHKKLYAVDDVSFEVYPGETLGLVGESGCGKSTVGNLLMQLLTPTAGEITYNGKSILKGNKKEQMENRRNIQMIFQDPYNSLNPRYTVRQILSEAFHVQKLGNKSELDAWIRATIEKTGIDPNMLENYPHELDGGRRQLVGITRALSVDPQFIVCDEPVSSLDVSVQANIINLLMDLQKKLGLSYLFISHDLSVVKHISDRIAVMYLGKIVEIATKEEIFENPMHPYTIALLSAVPSPDPEKSGERIILEGDVPNAIDPGEGCRFAPRCWMACDKCFKESPVLQEIDRGHCAACHRLKETTDLQMGAVKKK